MNDYMSIWVVTQNNGYDTDLLRLYTNEPAAEKYVAALVNCGYKTNNLYIEEWSAYDYFEGL